MGVSTAVLDLLTSEAARRRFSGRLLVLGKQDVWVTAQEVENEAAEKGLTLNKNNMGATESTGQGCGAMSDRSLFMKLGFSEVTSLDCSGYEEASLVFDLNDEKLPENARAAYDVILDIGVLEHVFDIAQAMKNLHDMLKTGGRIITFNPAIQAIDTCFYLLSPTFFCDYYSANAYEINKAMLYRFKKGYYHNDKIYQTVNYQPGILDGETLGLDGCYWDVYCVATKMSDSTGHKKPIQRYYAEIHERQNDHAATETRYQQSSDNSSAAISDRHFVQDTDSAHECKLELLKRIDNLEATIKHMESSKFWKMRSRWHRLRGLLSSAHS